MQRDESICSWDVRELFSRVHSRLADQSRVKFLNTLPANVRIEAAAGIEQALFLLISCIQAIAYEGDHVLIGALNGENTAKSPAEILPVAVEWIARSGNTRTRSEAELETGLAAAIEGVRNCGTGITCQSQSSGLVCELALRFAAAGRPQRALTKSILLVEDESYVRSAAGEVLEMAGYKVWDASNADEALKLFMQHQDDVDLVITDVVMPGMDGREFARMLHEINPDLPILLMSGYSNVPGESENPHFRYLPKPFNFNMLVEGVRQSIDSN